MTGNMYKDVETGYNALCGDCEHQCVYCSTQSLDYPACVTKYQGDYRLDEKVMKKSWGTGKFLFPCSQMDLFANGVPHEFICAILAKANKHDNKYRWQSKNPKRMLVYLQHFPKKSDFGTTIETNRDDIVLSKAPPVSERAAAMIELRNNGLDIFVTIEPIAKFDLSKLTKIIFDIQPRKVFIGADSKHHTLPEPTSEEIRELIWAFNFRGRFQVELKDNLKRLTEATL